MCSECLQYPCHPRCPNAPEPHVVYQCECCGAEIREGDTFYDICDEIWCEYCIEECRREAESEV